jgi:hypothetical protein
MKSITLQVPDEVYEACQQMARKYGRTVEECVMEFMLKYGPKPRPKLTEEEARATWERLMRHMGAQHLGYATGADNEGIDADLAREYSSSHEKEA